jgi:hypothetical protein
LVKGNHTDKCTHDHFAPYWALALVLLGATGLATIWVDLGAFWKGYVLDMTGPAWSYILFRGLYTGYAENAWRRFFTPGRTLAAFLLVLAGIEGMQYLSIYEATFDPWDFLAYGSVLIPLYFLDAYQQTR